MLELSVPRNKTDLKNKVLEKFVIKVFFTFHEIELKFNKNRKYTQYDVLVNKASTALDLHYRGSVQVK